MSAGRAIILVPRKTLSDQTWHCAGRAVYRASEQVETTVSESDSFIHEVSEEVRRDRLYALARRYGWLIVLAVFLIVGGAAANEWRKARDRTAAQAAGDDLRAAFLETDPSARAAKLKVVAAEQPNAAMLARLAEAGSLLEAGKRTEAAEILSEIAESGDTPEIYRELAALQRVMMLGPEMDLTQRQATIQPLAAEGKPFRLMALEQRALVALEQGKPDAAIADLKAILTDPATPSQMAGRARQLLVAAGGELSPDSLPLALPSGG
jgi:hypothetical protein